MIISHTNKFIFLRPAKVAGTSTQNFFQQFCDKQNDIIGMKDSEEYWNHMRPALIRQKMLRQDWQTYLKFGNIRNPWDRMVSSYFFNRRIKKSVPDDMSFEVYLHKFQEFTQLFTEKAKPRNPSSLCDFYGINDNLEEKEDYKYIRYENLQEDILNICDILNLKPLRHLQHMNKTNRNTDYRVYYNKQTRKIVEELYQKDIEKFEYTF